MIALFYIPTVKTVEGDAMKVAVITGAAQGIGRRTAEVFAAAGYALALLDARSCEATLAAVQAHEADAKEFRGDIADEGVVIRAAAGVSKRWGRVDVLVNNAGISFIAAAESMQVEDFRRVLEVNLVAPFLLAKHFGGMMLKQRAGSIVNVASIAGLMGVSDRSAYNASKHGLIGLTRTLAAEWGGRGVRSNAVCPGWVKTEMDAADQARGTYSDADIEGRNPMGRFATPDDVARAIAFLADPAQSGFINGQSLAVDGGWTVDGSWESLRLGKR
ncbi:MAG TPA: SDR family oxidoreductase [Acidobacteriaceae bacterium]|jgi:NAD(P)-dependent dehydrogenase (short-subunit alcohol dehydrogenase family)